MEETVFNRGKFFGPNKNALERVRGDIKNTFGGDCDLSEVRPSSRNDFEFFVTIALKEVAEEVTK